VAEHGVARIVAASRIRGQAPAQVAGANAWAAVIGQPAVASAGCALSKAGTNASQQNNNKGGEYAPEVGFMFHEPIFWAVYYLRCSGRLKQVGAHRYSRTDLFLTRIDFYKLEASVMLVEKRRKTG
jgi:hypothetical protein